MLCVECAADVKHVYREYGKGMIRLTKCESCQSFADKYVEFENMLLFLDLVLHKRAVYRHLLFNRDQLRGHSLQTALKLVPLYIFLDSYLKWMRLKHWFEQEPNVLPTQYRYGMPYDRHGTIALVSMCELAVFVLGAVLAVRLLEMVAGLRLRRRSIRHIVLAILVSSFGKLLVIPMMIWPYDIQFAYAVHVFVLSSNRLSLQTFFMDQSMTRAIAAVVAAFFLRAGFMRAVYAYDPTMIPFYV